MDVLFFCSSCQMSLQVAEALAGKQVRCPKCLAVTTAPLLDEAVPLAQLVVATQLAEAIQQPRPHAAIPPPLDADNIAEPTEEAAAVWHVLCPACQRQLLVTEDRATLRCPGCYAGFASQTPLPVDGADMQSGSRRGSWLALEEARRQAKAAAPLFTVACLITLLMIIVSLFSFLWIENRVAEQFAPPLGGPLRIEVDPRFNGGKPAPPRERALNPNERAAKRLADGAPWRYGTLLGCGVLAVVSAIFQLQAGRALRSLRGKGRVIAAIVFALVLAMSCAFSVVAGFYALALGPAETVAAAVRIHIGFNVVTALSNLLAGVCGIFAICRPSVSQAFHRSLAT